MERDWLGIWMEEDFLIILDNDNQITVAFDTY